MPTQVKDETQSKHALTRREFIGMTAGMALTLLLQACRQRPTSAPPMQRPSGPLDTEHYKKPSPWRIGRSGRGDINSWLVMLSAHIEYGVKEKYREHFSHYFCTSANWDPNKQIEDIKTLLQEGIDLLLIDPLDHPVVAAGIAQAMDAGVPVIFASTRARNAPYVTRVTQNEAVRGAACADWMCRSIRRGRVAIVASAPASGDNKAWLAAVRDRLDSRPDIETVAVEHCPWQSSEARRVMSSILTESPPVDGVIVNNGVLGRGVVLAFAEHDRDIPPIAGVDDWNGWLRTAAEHKVGFLGLSGGASLGLLCVELATRVLAGHPVRRDVVFPHSVFDHRDLHRYYRPDLTDHYWTVNDLPQAWIERMFNT